MELPNPLYALSLGALQRLRQWLEERHTEYAPLIPEVQDAIEYHEEQYAITKHLIPDPDDFSW